MIVATIDLSLLLGTVSGTAAGSGGEAIPENVLRLLGRLHPMVVHFPIGLIMAAFLFELLNVFRPKQRRAGAALPCLMLGAVGAAVAAWFGWINATVEPQGSSVETTLFFHRWLGVGVAGLALATVLVGVIDRRRPSNWVAKSYFAGLLISCVMVGVGGHLGASLVYGQGYLVDALREPGPVLADDNETPAVATVVKTGASAEPSPSEPSRAEPSRAAKPSVPDEAPNAHAVQLIINDRCINCHGPRRQKARLRLDDLRAVVGTDRALIVPGAPDESAIVQRIQLPADDPDLMPAKGGPLTAAQIKLVTAWIAAGAAVGDLPTPAPVVKSEVGASIEAEPAPPKVEPAARDQKQRTSLTASEQAAVDAALTRLRERGATAIPIARDSIGIDVNVARLGQDFGDADLALLDGLQPVLRWLNLGRTAVTNDGVATLSVFKTLERLHLEETAITDDGLASIGALPHLAYLNVYGTEITDAGLTHLASATSLTRLYAWRTSVTDEGVTRLIAALPKLVVNTGAELVTEPAAEEAAAEEPPLPGCCATAVAAGKTCDHPCCVEAAVAGKICPQCSS